MRCMRGGWGRGWKRRCYSTGKPGWMRYESERDEKLRMLERMRDELEAELEEIKREIERLRR
ncbi:MULTISPECIES: DUF5320 family protein [Archaeoglobus]|uniref:Uncharacterized protein AF_0667 n=3 Tax=Archaeoglobus fulgidus TaxID=2234 RepID=Y667_ARCFU|nr:MULTISPECIES: DUF5320 family protein [Archaeoglobus]O29590.1 RecName: Full=Uncharacterized protein AF_0667 [Archaeoglobus fulgidus DSM 4304]AAB90574.1 predicted coding region AF_0667 [Archaeoglobus fulgidus DSM 4304]AIG97545.1 hypothetical protein AFULGI_00007470 [Archaeoglobus fulgidus DSM 8774]KUJ94254.1 MAG: hypothetical protein XD40_0498 [Archaeoglobus fulgidus]KUK07529.1 MAG: Uncharacterized protein XD48_0183 [Archaeoglobus fulgidus]MDI3498557.1 hypothetical protein [Archaeoglobus sp.